MSYKTARVVMTAPRIQILPFFSQPYYKINEPLTCTLICCLLKYTISFSINNLKFDPSIITMPTNRSFLSKYSFAIV